MGPLRYYDYQVNRCNTLIGILNCFSVLNKYFGYLSTLSFAFGINRQKNYNKIADKLRTVSKQAASENQKLSQQTFVSEGQPVYSYLSNQ